VDEGGCPFLRSSISLTRPSSRHACISSPVGLSGPGSGHFDDRFHPRHDYSYHTSRATRKPDSRNYAAEACLFHLVRESGGARLTSEQRTVLTITTTASKRTNGVKRVAHVSGWRGGFWGFRATLNLRLNKVDQRNKHFDPVNQ
jgi:hypothetical protein